MALPLPLPRPLSLSFFDGKYECALRTSVALMQFQWSMLKTLFFDLPLLLSLLLLLLLLFDPLVFYAHAGYTICFSFGRGRTEPNPWRVDGRYWGEAGRQGGREGSRKRPAAEAGTQLPQEFSGNITESKNEDNSQRGKCKSTRPFNNFRLLALPPTPSHCHLVAATWQAHPHPRSHLMRSAYLLLTS